jgi:hypothetical protein
MAVVSLVQTGTTTIAAGDPSEPVTIPTTLTDLSKTFLWFHLSPSITTPSNAQVTGRIDSTTQMTFQSSAGATAAARTVRWFLAEFSSGVSVQRGSFSIPVTTNNVVGTASLSPTVDPTKSFSIITKRGDGSNYGDDDFFSGEISADGTTLTFSRQGTDTVGGNSVIEWQVVEYDGCSVQRGTTSLGSGATSNTATTDRDSTAISNALGGWLITDVRNLTGTNTNMAQKAIKGEITNNSTLTFSRQASGADGSVHWQLVKFSDGSAVQTGTVSFTTTSDASEDATLSPSVDTAKSIVTFAGVWGRFGTTDYTAAGSFNSAAYHGTLGGSSPSSTLTITRDVAANTGTGTGTWFVVTFNAAAGTTHDGTLSTSASGSSSFSGIFVLVAHPTGDVSVGGWTTTPLYQKIDEVTASIADFVTSVDNPTSDAFEVNLTSLSGVDPNGVQTVEYILATADSTTLDTIVTLLEGTTIIASWLHEDVPNAWTLYSSELSTEQRAAITDYTNLRLRFTAFEPIFRDRFLTDDASPIASSRAAEPGPSTVSFTNTSDWYIKNDWLRSMGQSSPTWGNMKALWSGITRTTGHALIAHVAVGDRNQDFAVGFASGTGVANARVDGHAWVMQEGFLEVSEPTRNVRLGGSGDNGYEVRPTEHLPVIALNNKGAVYLLSSYDDGDGSPALGRLYPRPFAKYPKATVLWRNDSDTTATLYPLISSYDRLGQHNAYKDVRLVSVSDWSSVDFISTHVERFDTNFTLGSGTGWTIGEGTWASSSGTLGMTGGSFRRRAYKNFGLVGNGFWRCKVTLDSTDTTKEVGFVFRVVDNNNFVYFTLGNGNVTIHYFNSGNYMWALYNNPSPVTLVAGQTYDCCVCTDGDYWRVWVNGQEPGPGWVTITDVYESGTGFGPYAGAATDARWDDFVCDPLEVDLPPEIRAGSVPNEWVVGETVFEDTFTDVNGTSLDFHDPTMGTEFWSELGGTWTIQSNRASGGSFAIIDTGTTNHEVEGDIILPSSVTTVRAGWIMRWVDVNNNVYFRLFKDAGQPGTDEIEVLGVTGGVTLDIMKVQFPSYFTSNQTVHVKAQIKDDTLRVWMDGQPVLTHITEVMTGNCGMYREVGVDDGSVFDNFIVRAIL